jgi:hypothetical protein
MMIQIVPAYTTQRKRSGNFPVVYVQPGFSPMHRLPGTGWSDQLYGDTKDGSARRAPIQDDLSVARKALMHLKPSRTKDTLGAVPLLGLLMPSAASGQR